MCFRLFIFPCCPSIRSGTRYHSPVNVCTGCPTSITVYMPCSAYTQENLATQHYLEEVLVRNNGWLVVLVLLSALQLMCWPRHATPHHKSPSGLSLATIKGVCGRSVLETAAAPTNRQHHHSAHPNSIYFTGSSDSWLSTEDQESRIQNCTALCLLMQDTEKCLQPSMQ